jgi:hypothetical protein
LLIGWSSYFCQNKTLNMAAPRKKPVGIELLPEDIQFDVLVHGKDKPEFLIHFVWAHNIYRISESIEHRNMACVWVTGENPEFPLIVNCNVVDLYQIWVEVRKNIYQNQITLNQ